MKGKGYCLPNRKKGKARRSIMLAAICPRFLRPKEMEPQRHGDHPGKVVKAMEGDTPTPFTMGEVARGVWRKLRSYKFRVKVQM